MNFLILTAIICTPLLLIYCVVRNGKKKDSLRWLDELDNESKVELSQDGSRRELVDFDFLPYNSPNLPRSDVSKCLKKKLSPVKFEHHRPCPQCGTPSEQLSWIRFRSSDNSWRNLCGRAGPLSICPVCNIQVEFIVEMMN